MQRTKRRAETYVGSETSMVPGVSTSLLCVGLVAGAIECFWQSAQIDDESGSNRASRQRWRLAGAALTVAALGLARRPSRV
jgi:hypothetical protein